MLEEFLNLFLLTYFLQTYLGIFMRFLPLPISNFTCLEKERVHVKHDQRLNM